MKKLFIGILFLSLFIGKVSTAGTIDLKKLCEDIVDMYKLEEVPAKKERLVYKKLKSFFIKYNLSRKCTNI